MPPTFTSARLAFRPYQPSDFDRLAALNADSKVMEYFPATVDKAGTRALVRRIQESFRENSYGWYSVDRLSDGQFIGLIGFLHPDFESFFTPCVEIGWRLHRDAWGQGYATEGARACLAHGQDELGLERIYSYTALPNRRSERVMQKAGMRWVGRFEHPLLEKGHPLRTHVVYCTP